MSASIKLTVVMTHPAQYYSPWFRYLAANCPELELTVLYATQPTPEQQGIGFGQAFAWDMPLTEGYRCRVMREARADDNVHSDSFRGVDVPEIASAIEASRPEVVLLSGWHSITQLRALWACRQLSIPVLYRGDTNLNNAPLGWRKLAWQTKTGFLLNRFAAHLAVGQRARDYLRWFGVREDRIFASPHCVDNDFFAQAAATHQTATGRRAAREAFGLAADDFVVLFAGKLEAIKRPLDLIRALAELGKGETLAHEQATEPASNRASLLIVGAGALEKECRAEVERLGVRAVWAGFLNQSQIARAFAAADCLVLPSESETWGLAVNEALATGLPCVVSDRVGCAPDLVVPGETGEVFPMGNIAELQAALKRVRDRSRAGQQWNDACRAKADEYSFAAATKGLLAGCSAVAKRKV